MSCQTCIKPPYTPFNDDFSTDVDKNDKDVPFEVPCSPTMMTTFREVFVADPELTLKEDADWDPEDQATLADFSIKLYDVQYDLNPYMIGYRIEPNDVVRLALYTPEEYNKNEWVKEIKKLSEKERKDVIFFSPFVLKQKNVTVNQVKFDVVKRGRGAYTKLKLEVYIFSEKQFNLSTLYPPDLTKELRIQVYNTLNGRIENHISRRGQRFKHLSWSQEHAVFGNVEEVQEKLQHWVRHATDITPYPYQLRSIGYMAKIEDALDKGDVVLEHYTVTPSSIKLADDLFYVRDEGFVKTDPCVDIVPARFNAFRGGVLSDDTGLGKTVTTVLLTALRGAKRGNDGGTLMIVPSPTLYQWKDTIQKFTRGLSILTISSQKDLENITSRDIANYHYVILSSDFLDSKANRAVVEEKSRVVHKKHHRRTDDFSFDGFKNLASEVQTFSLGEEQGFLAFVAVHWTRAVIDEYHELGTFEKEFIKRVKCHYIWLLSGTPTYDLDISMLLSSPCPADWSTLNAFVHRNLYIRHVKDSEAVRNDFTMPTVVKEIQYVEFLPKERLIYNEMRNADSNKLHEFCCHSQVGDFEKEETVNDVFQLLLERNQKKLDETEQRLVGLTTQIETLEKQLKDEEDVKKITEKANKIVNLKEQRKGVEIRFRNLSASSNFFGALTKIDLKETECSICFETLADHEKVTVLDCGHLFCKGCGDSLKNLPKFKCAECRHLPKETMTVSTEPPSEFNKLRARIGSKMAALMTFLKNSSEKIVLFVRSPQVFSKTYRLLKENNINFVATRGTFNQLQNSIHDFSSKPEVKIILMSSEFASGTNMTVSSHVCFLDPDANSSFEKQAIARVCRIGQKSKTVKITSFVVRDTIEDDEVGIRELVPEAME